MATRFSEIADNTLCGSTQDALLIKCQRGRTRRSVDVVLPRRRPSSRGAGRRRALIPRSRTASPRRRGVAGLVVSWRAPWRAQPLLSWKNSGVEIFARRTDRSSTVSSSCAAQLALCQVRCYRRFGGGVEEANASCLTITDAVRRQANRSMELRLETIEVTPSGRGL